MFAGTGRATELDAPSPSPALSWQPLCGAGTSRALLGGGIDSTTLTEIYFSMLVVSTFLVRSYTRSSLGCGRNVGQ